MRFPTTAVYPARTLRPSTLAGPFKPHCSAEGATGRSKELARDPWQSIRTGRQTGRSGLDEALQTADHRLIHSGSWASHIGALSFSKVGPAFKLYLRFTLVYTEKNRNSPQTTCPCPFVINPGVSCFGQHGQPTRAEGKHRVRMASLNSV